MNQPPVHALFDPRREGQVWPQPATWPGIPYVQGMSGTAPVVSALHDPRREGQPWPEPSEWPGIPYVQGMSGTAPQTGNTHTKWRGLILPAIITGVVIYFVANSLSSEK